MNNYSNDFESFDGKIWLNAASEGPLPKVSNQALQEAIIWKSKPYLLDIPKFVDVPLALKSSIARLIHVDSKEVVLGNSATYGIEILANGIPLNPGDEVLLMRNDFPSDILPWLGLTKKGVIVKQLAAKHLVLSPDELSQQISSRTKVVCLPHVHTFTGLNLQAEKMAALCRANNIIFILNITQSAGTREIDLSQMDVDAAVCAGYKWLLGPYGTGFCWIKTELRERLELYRAYWPAALSETELHSSGDIQYHEIKTARKYDIYGTANFFNFVPFRSSIDYLLQIGLDRVAEHNGQLIDILLDRLDGAEFELISEKDKKQRSNLLVLSHKNKNNNAKIHQYLKDRGIYTAFWKNNIRLTPHIYNTADEMTATAEALNATAKKNC